MYIADNPFRGSVDARKNVVAAIVGHGKPHKAGVRDPVYLERMKMVNSLCS